MDPLIFHYLKIQRGNSDHRRIEFIYCRPQRIDLKIGKNLLTPALSRAASLTPLELIANHCGRTRKTAENQKEIAALHGCRAGHVVFSIANMLGSQL